MSLIEIFKKGMLSPNKVIDKAIKIKLVEELQIDAYNLYLKAEKKEGMHAIREHLSNKISSRPSVEEVIEESAKMFKELDRFFLSLTQSRRARAGKAFEVILKTLFKKINYPFDEQQVINGKPDFLMPSRKYYDRNAMDCIIFTAKRTLRERWRQIVTEGTRGLGFYLATIDEKVSKNALDEMKKHRIYLIVPKKIKSTNSEYPKAENVITFEDFFKYHLDPAVKRWRDKKVI